MFLHAKEVGSVYKHNIFLLIGIWSKIHPTKILFQRIIPVNLFTHNFALFPKIEALI